MKVSVAVVVVVLTLFALVMPASASVRDYVPSASTKSHPYGWMKRAPVDQAELNASIAAAPGSERIVAPAASDAAAAPTVRRSARSARAT